MKKEERVRPPAVAGTWYPGTAGALAREVDTYLQAAPDGPEGPVTALIAPHAGMLFSGAVAAHAYKAAAGRAYEHVVLVGPSHYVAFDGIAACDEGAFATPLGYAPIDRELTECLLREPGIRALSPAHAREHSLEMQLPFVQRLMPDARIVPLLMGFQSRDTIAALAAALAAALRGRRALLVASSDLSHYQDARTAEALDGRVTACVDACDPAALLEVFEAYPEHERGRYVACGGGPMIAVMTAARDLGARDARVLKYAHSGEVSGDYEAVVGYLAAVLGEFEA